MGELSEANDGAISGGNSAGLRMGGGGGETGAVGWGRDFGDGGCGVSLNRTRLGEVAAAAGEDDPEGSASREGTCSLGERLPRLEEVAERDGFSLNCRSSGTMMVLRRLGVRTRALPRETVRWMPL